MAFVRVYPWEPQEMFPDRHPGILLVRTSVSGTGIRQPEDRGETDTSREGTVGTGAVCIVSSPLYLSSGCCNPGQGREKDGVEALVAFSRRNFVVPVPEVGDFEDLNAQ